MAKVEWGTKRTCFACGARFYDLRREPIHCPICQVVYDPARQPRPKRGSAMRDEPVLVAAADGAATAAGGELLDEEGAEAEMEDVEEGEDAGDDSDMEDLTNEEGEIIEDASELGEDDDDIGEVMEHVDDEIEDKA